MTLAKTVKYSLHWGEATQVNRLYVLRLLWEGQVGNYHRHRWNVSPQLCLSKRVNLNIIAPSTSPWTHLLCAQCLLHFQCSLCCVTAQPAPLPEHQRKIFYQDIEFLLWAFRSDIFSSLWCLQVPLSLEMASVSHFRSSVSPERAEPSQLLTVVTAAPQAQSTASV